MQWKRADSPRPKKFRTVKSAGKRMVAVIWNCQGVLLIDWLEPDASINSDAYVETLTKLRRAIQNKRPGKWAEGVLLQHDNARPHTGRKTASIGQLVLQVLPHPSYSPGLD